MDKKIVYVCADRARSLQTGDLWKTCQCPSNILITKLTTLIDEITELLPQHFFNNQEREQQVITDLFGSQEEPLEEEGDDENQDPVRIVKVCLAIISRSRNIWSTDQATGALKLAASPDKIYTFIKYEPNKTMSRFGVFFHLMKIVLNLLVNDKVVTKREIYYNNVNLFKNQRNVDTAIEDLACTFGVTRFNLNIIGGSKGLVGGNLKIELMSGVVLDTLDYGYQGLLIPPMDQIKSLTITGDRMIVIEKEATFSCILNRGWNGECVFVTGKGYPDVSTKQLVRKISSMDVPEDGGSTTLNIQENAEQNGEEFDNEQEAASFLLVEEGQDSFDPESEVNSLLQDEIHSFSPLQHEQEMDLDSEEVDLENEEIFEPFEMNIDESPLNLDEEGYFIAEHPLMDINAVADIVDEEEEDVNENIFEPEQPSKKKVRVLAVVDCDPHGLEIALTYKIGSKSMGYHNSTLIAPTLQLAGILYSHWNDYSIPKSSLIPFTSEDWKKSHSLVRRLKKVRKYDDEIKFWIRQLCKIMHCGYKSEIQAVSERLVEFMEDICR